MTRELRVFAKNRIEYLLKISSFVFDECDRGALVVALQALSQEPCEDWYDVPSDEMTLEQARQAVKDLRKKLAEYLDQQPCDDVVSRILKRMWNWRGKHTTSIDKVAMEQIIRDELPPVTPKPETVTEFADRCRECGARYGKLLEQKSGHWISHYDEDEKVGWYECDRCHTERAFNTRFCPDCGAYMREGRTLDEFIEDSKESEVEE